MKSKSEKETLLLRTKDIIQSLPEKLRASGVAAAYRWTEEDKWVAPIKEIVSQAVNQSFNEQAINAGIAMLNDLMPIIRKFMPATQTAIKESAYQEITTHLIDAPVEYQKKVYSWAANQSLFNGSLQAVMMERKLHELDPSVSYQSGKPTASRGNQHFFGEKQHTNYGSCDDHSNEDADDNNPIHHGAGKS